MKDQIEALVLQMYRGGILYREALHEFKKAFVTAALRANGGNVSKTAPRLGLHRNSLTRTVSELQLEVKALRPRRRPPGSAFALPVIVGYPSI